jgi:hypothetical protein
VAAISVSIVPGFAQDFNFHTEWVAQMEPDEGGDVFTASVFAAPVAGSDYPPEIRMTCFGSVNVRYLFPDSGAEPPASDFTFTSESGSVTLRLQYEEMRRLCRTARPIRLSGRSAASWTVTEATGASPRPVFAHAPLRTDARLPVGTRWT